MKNRGHRLTILFSGMIAADPHQGGATWAVLQYLLGLKKLGHDVFFVEPVKASALRPEGSGLAQSINAAYFRDVVRDFGLDQNSALLLEDSQQTTGAAYSQLLAFARRADVLINISGMLTDEALVSAIPRRVYLDLDPAFNQLWQSVYGIDMRFDAHTHFVTIGLALGSAECPVPTCGRNWIKTAQPIVLDEWPVATQLETDALTTVGNWRGYGSIDFQGVHYGQKAHSLREFFPLPMMMTEKFALALAIHPDEKADVAALAKNRWQILNPAAVAGSPVTYREFVRGSKAEFGIAKSGYVVSRCGWFSDRSVCYLASGRPVIAQDTGFSKFFPTGEGLFEFHTVEGALAAIETMNRDYPRHRRAARALAEDYFDSDKVLPRLLEAVGS